MRGVIKVLQGEGGRSFGVEESEGLVQVDLGLPIRVREEESDDMYAAGP